MTSKGEKELNASLGRIAKSSIIVLVGLLLSKVLMYGYRIMIAREFGPETYGLFALALMVSGWFIAFSGFGLNMGVLRFVSIYRAKGDGQKISRLMRSSFLLLLVVGLVSGFVLYIFSPFIAERLFHNPDLTLFLRLFSILVPVSNLLTLFLAAIKAYERITAHVIIADVLTSALNAGLLLVLLLAGFGSEAIPYSFVGGSFIALIVATVFLKCVLSWKSSKRSAATEKEKVLSNVLAYSWPFLFSGIIWKVFHWTDSFFLGVFMTSTDVGVYNASVSIAFLLSLSLQLFMQLFFPLVSREISKGNREEVNQLSKQVSKWVIMINLPIFATFILFPEVVINLFFGQEFISAASALRILSVGVLLYSFAGVSEKLLGAAGKSKTIFFDSFIIVIVNLILNWVLVPLYGLNGAALATTLSLGVLTFVFTYQATKVNGSPPLRRVLFKIFFAGVLASIVFYYVVSVSGAQTFLFLVFSFLLLCLYLWLVFLFKGFDRHDIFIFKSALSRMGLRK